MDQDKALQKVLSQHTGEVPFGFEERIMKRIQLEAVKKNRRSEQFNLLLVSMVSLLLSAGTAWILKHFFSFSLLDLFSGIHLHFGHNRLFIYCFYLAFLILALLGLDHLFRQLAKKTGKN